MIELTGISKTFGVTPVLQAVNLSVAQGEIMAIIGKSGAGKSTLLRCINLLERPDTGRVVVNQQQLMDFSPALLRQARYKIGMIFQHFNLLMHQTVAENISLPMRIQGASHAAIEEKLAELLPLVELSDKAHAYPAQLSGGQKQRVAIARALSCSPELLLCDEATSALDPETTDAILALLKKINALYGITMVVVTHEMDVVKRLCQRLAVMDKGRIIEVTTMAQALKDKNSVARTLLFSQLSPALPVCLAKRLQSTPNHSPVVKLYFEGQETTTPFISQVSRELSLDINILLANVSRFDALTCGVLIAELRASHQLLNDFIARSEQAGLTVEIIGYVANASL